MMRRNRLVEIALAVVTLLLLVAAIVAEHSPVMIWAAIIGLGFCGAALAPRS